MQITDKNDLICMELALNEQAPEGIMVESQEE